MIEEPYRWLEAVQNRREYIEDQLRGAAPVIAVSGEPGILLLAGKASTPKIFEIYDHLALGAVGHPADLEKIRQTAIEAAHVEGFSRSRADVSARRIVSYGLAGALKSAFEQIFAAPLLFRGILVELRESPSADEGWILEYDGGYAGVEPEQMVRGALIGARKDLAALWREESQKVPPPSGKIWKELAQHALRALAWASQEEGEKRVPWAEFLPSKEWNESARSDRFEVGVLSREASAGGGPAFLVPEAEQLGWSGEKE
ncbi:proteasome alpha subunit [Methylacidimicrobium cyclopophantes]|uniref:Proteasome alpha subunit n=1 Tax=Methylacidimicrobium cyclopophantes TaxID=1041766 RepID=A0A5E6M722_9BACT|nr:proteasome subunit alpha [Methylacidimicrobium cyclopophantes]VVM05349.1 proteasome alpha subunit [Methylacidimicrobium cyclopophantes]